MGVDSRLMSSARMRDRYGTRSGVIGVARTHRNVSVVEGVWYPNSEDPPEFPEWSNGLKVVQAAIWRDPRNVGDIVDQDITQTAAGTFVSGNTDNGFETIDLYPQMNGLVIRQVYFYVGGNLDFVGPLISGRYDAIPSTTPIADSGICGAFYGNSGGPCRAFNAIGQEFTVYSVDGSNNAVIPVVNGEKVLASQDQTDLAVSASHRYYGVKRIPNRTVGYKITASPKGITATEAQAIAVKIEDGSYPLLNGSIPLRGGDVLTIGYSASNMPEIEGGGTILSIDLDGNSIDPGISYCFIVQ